MSSITSAAVVQLGRPEVLALGAATGTPASRMMDSVTWWSGHRTPTVSSPAVVASGTMGFRFRIMVRGPGQNCWASAYASGGTSVAVPGQPLGSRNMDDERVVLRTALGLKDLA